MNYIQHLDTSKWINETHNQKTDYKKRNYEWREDETADQNSQQKQDHIQLHKIPRCSCFLFFYFIFIYHNDSQISM